MGYKKQTAGSILSAYIVGGGSILIALLLFLPWWIAGVWFGVLCFYGTIAINWQLTPVKLRKALIKAEFDYEKGLRNDAAQKLKEAQAYNEQLRAELKRLNNGGSDNA